MKIDFKYAVSILLFKNNDKKKITDQNSVNFTPINESKIIKKEDLPETCIQIIQTKPKSKTTFEGKKYLIKKVSDKGFKIIK